VTWLPTNELRFKERRITEYYAIEVLQQKFIWEPENWNPNENVRWKDISRVPHTALDNYSKADMVHNHTLAEECTPACMPVAK
jgi:hypothetical protein